MVNPSNFVDEKGLIPEETWRQVIDTLKSRVSGTGDKDKLKEAIVSAVKKRIPKEPFGVFFSGGVDSALIALILKQLGAKFTCYTVGFKHEESEIPWDVFYARKLAEELNLNYVEKLYGISEAKDIIREAVKIFPEPKVFNTEYYVTIDVASVVVAAKSIAKEKIFFSGLGSEEIFAGYNRHLKTTEVNEECWKGLKEMWSRDLYRDATLGIALEINLLVPLLDEDVIIEAMKFEGDRKINREHKKIILREIAEELGLPKEIAWRKKQGAQYGSKFDRAIEKLAKMNGFFYKQEYIESVLKDVKKK